MAEKEDLNLEEARERTRSAAKVAGRIIASREWILETLAENGDVSAELEEVINKQKDADVLRLWFSYGLNAKDVNEFVKRLRLDYATQLTEEFSELDFLKVLEFMELIKAQNKINGLMTERKVEEAGK
ncbi:MAG: hypothetical protein E7231_03240 [Cellulosilyticum sp.]|nr:hypothetical protein [Cellulosilyticum sp.]